VSKQKNSYTLKLLVAFTVAMWGMHLSLNLPLLIDRIERHKLLDVN